MLLTLHVDDSRVAVGLAGVVYKARRVPVHRGVHHLEVVDTEHVASNALARQIITIRTGTDWREMRQGNIQIFSAHLPVVIFLTLVGESGTDDDARILDDHLARLDVSLTEKPSSVNRRPKTVPGISKKECYFLFKSQLEYKRAFISDFSQRH